MQVRVLARRIAQEKAGQDETRRLEELAAQLQLGATPAASARAMAQAADGAALPGAGAPPVALDELLSSAGLGHLNGWAEERQLTVGGLCAEYASGGRTAFLSMLKAQGVEKLADRQKLSNAVGKAAKQAPS